MNNYVKNKGVYFDGEIDQLNINVAVGKIGYLGVDSKVVETVWYTDEE